MKRSFENTGSKFSVSPQPPAPPWVTSWDADFVVSTFSAGPEFILDVSKALGWGARKTVRFYQHSCNDIWVATRSRRYVTAVLAVSYHGESVVEGYWFSPTFDNEFWHTVFAHYARRVMPEYTSTWAVRAEHAALADSLRIIGYKAVRANDETTTFVCPPFKSLGERGFIPDKSSARG